MCTNWEDHAVESFEVGGLSVDIYPDIGTESPRTAWEPFGVMYTWSTKYGRGVENTTKRRRAIADLLRDFDGYDGPVGGRIANKFYYDSDEYAAAVLKAAERAGVVLRLLRFGQNGPEVVNKLSNADGFIYATEQMIRDNWVIKRVTKKYREWAESLIDGEIGEYRQWANNEIYRFEITDREGETVGSDYDRRGWYGLDLAEREARREAVVLARKQAQEEIASLRADIVTLKQRAAAAVAEWEAARQRFDWWRENGQPADLAEHYKQLESANRGRLVAEIENINFEIGDYKEQIAELEGVIAELNK